MVADKYIPAGRTSLITKESGPVQLQTEYTYRPYPRITTTILNAGQVLHKIEKRLEREVGSAEELVRMEEIIRRQHAEVEAIIKREDMTDALAVHREPAPSPQPAVPEETPDTRNKLREVPGVEHIYRIGNDGEFHGQATELQFKKAFAAIFKGIHELLGLFDKLPGPKRRQGVYEVERDRLYLVSLGEECLFVTVNRVDRDTDFEQALKKAAFGEWGPDFELD